MAPSTVESLIRASVPVVVVTVLALARWYFPAKSAREFGTSYSVEQLSVRFRSRQWLVGGGMVLTGAIIAGVFHAILAGLNTLCAVLDGPAELVLPPQSAIWWILPIFAGITMTWQTTLGIWSMFGDRKEAALYAYWSMATAGFDGERVMRWMAVIIGVPGAALTLLAIPAHNVLRNQDIRAHGYGFGAVKTYRYSEAHRMTIIRGFRSRDGKLIKRAGVVLDFANGRRWSSADIADFRPSVDPKLVSYIQGKTGLEPQYEETESDIPAGRVVK